MTNKRENSFLYNNGLSIAFLIMAIITIGAQTLTGLSFYNDFLTDGLQSFQNWQSEFLSVFAIIFLSIYLREIGSSQSKPVEAPNAETGE